MLKPLVKYVGWPVYAAVGRAYLTPFLRIASRDRREPTINERPIEYAYTLRALSSIGAREVLDVGAGMSAWPGLLKDCGFNVTAVDKISGYWRFAFFNRHYRIVRDDITSTHLARRFDAVTCISVLEHIPDHVGAIRAMAERLADSGSLIVTCPYNEREYQENVYRRPDATYGHDAPYICRAYSRAEVDRWCSVAGLEIDEEEFYEVFDGPFWACGPRLPRPRAVGVEQLHHLACFRLSRVAASADG